MVLKDDIQGIILNTPITFSAEALKGFDAEKSAENPDPEFFARSMSLVGFYNNLMSQQNMRPEVAAKSFIAMTEFLVRKAVMQATLDYLELYKEEYAKTDAVLNAPPLGIKQKSVQDFKSYLLYAANKFGDKKDVQAIERLVEKIQDEKVAV